MQISGLCGSDIETVRLTVKIDLKGYAARDGCEVECLRCVKILFLRGGRQLPVQQQVTSLEKVAVLGELLDWIAAVFQDAGVLEYRGYPIEQLAEHGDFLETCYLLLYGELPTAAQKKDFDASQAFDFATVSSRVPLEIYFNGKADRLYVTTAKPGNLHIFDVSGGVEQPKLIKSIPTAEGSHHVGITPDERYAFVQNALLNLPGMSDGSVTVVDLQKQEVVKSMDTLKDAGFNPNSIALLPAWYNAAGH